MMMQFASDLKNYHFRGRLILKKRSDGNSPGNNLQKSAIS